MSMETAEVWKTKRKREKKPLTEQEVQVLALWNTDRFRASDIAEKIGIEARRVSSMLQILRERGENVHNNTNRRATHRSNGQRKAKSDAPMAETFRDIQIVCRAPGQADIAWCDHRPGLCIWPAWGADKSIGPVCGLDAEVDGTVRGHPIFNRYCSFHRLKSR